MGPPWFTFLIVQLPNYCNSPGKPDATTWTEIRESQFVVGQLPGNGVSVNIDIGEADNIHPKNKQDFGYRLALVALRGRMGRRM